MQKLTTVDLEEAWNNRKYQMGGKGATGPRTNQDTGPLIDVGRIKSMPTYGPGLLEPINSGIMSIKGPMTSRVDNCLPILKI